MVLGVVLVVLLVALMVLAAVLVVVVGVPRVPGSGLVIAVVVCGVVGGGRSWAGRSGGGAW